VPRSNDQIAGQRELERLLAECQKLNQRLELLIGVIEWIGRAEDGERR
jgi:hypothetical protein